jgi:drug/metabolite transporter (DMT)-like permease
MINPKCLLAIFTLAMLWGPSFLFTKIAVGDIAPFTLVALRISFGTLLLYALVKYKNIRLLRNPRLWAHCFIIGIFANGLPFICFSYSILYIPTSLSALINGTTPLLTVILANQFVSDEPLTWNRGIGVAFGLSGFLVLFLPSLIGVDLGLDLRGIVLSFIGACCYAVGIVYARVHVQKVPPLVAPMLQLLSSLTYLIPLAFIVESPIALIQSASISAWACVAGLSILGTFFAYIMYYRILAKYGATSLGMVPYLIPIIGTILGVVFLNESLSIPFVIAASLILCGVLIMNGTISLPTPAAAKS